MGGVQQLLQGGGFNIGSLIGAPFNAIGGAFSGFFRGLFPGGLMWGGILAALVHFAPEFVGTVARKIGEMIGDDQLDERVAEMAERARSGGIGSMAMTYGLAGSTLSGGMGALTGAFQGLLGGGNQQQGQQQGGNLGGVLIGGLAFAGIAAVAIGALNRQGVEGGTDADHSEPATPAHVPPANGLPESRIPA